MPVKYKRLHVYVIAQVCAALMGSPTGLDLRAVQPHEITVNHNYLCIATKRVDLYIYRQQPPSNQPVRNHVKKMQPISCDPPRFSSRSSAPFISQYLHEPWSTLSLAAAVCVLVIFVYIFRCPEGWRGWRGGVGFVHFPRCVIGCGC